MTRPRTFATAIAAALLFTGFVMAGPTAATSTPGSQQISRLLSAVKTQAVILSTDADRMESYTRSGVSWEGHADEIDQMRDHINKAGRELAQLEELRQSAAPWQAVAMDRIHEPLQELADNTRKAIRFIDQDPSRLFEPQYTDYLEANADVASRLANMVSNYVDYGRTKHRLESLAAKLELPAKR